MEVQSLSRGVDTVVRLRRGWERYVRHVEFEVRIERETRGVVQGDLLFVLPGKLHFLEGVFNPSGHPKSVSFARRF